MTDACCPRCGRALSRAEAERRAPPRAEAAYDPVRAALMLPWIGLALLGFATGLASQPSPRRIDGPPNFSKWRI